MTSRERFRTALNHQEPDRVPIDQGSLSGQNGLHEVAYRNLLRYLGLPEEETRIYCYMQRLAAANEAVRERLHTDTYYLISGPSSAWQFEETDDRTWVDEWGVVRQYNGLYADTVRPALAGVRSISDLKSYPWPDPLDPARFAGLRERTKSLYETTDYALMFMDAACIQYMATELLGWERFLEDIVLDPPFVMAVVDKLTDFYAQFSGRLLDEVGQFVEIVWMADDWGMQGGPVFNPTIFREQFVPRYKELIGLMKSKTRAKIGLHSCGSVVWAMPDLIDAGVEVLHPLQARAKDMDPERIKREFGDHLVFYSGIDNQHILPHGTPAEVAEEVRNKVVVYAPGGGYVFSCGHNIQADVPPENILAAIDAVLENGRYPIVQPR